MQQSFGALETRNVDIGGYELSNESLHVMFGLML
jgi:hypothetical protein